MAARVLGSSCGEDASQDTIAVGTLGFGVTSRMMHRIGDNVCSEVARELDHVSETTCCFEAEGLRDSIW
jgi:hypothetical protein